MLTHYAKAEKSEQNKQSSSEPILMDTCLRISAF